MSRYRKTMSEALEEIRQESKMKSIYDMAFDGDSANEIAKKLKVDVATVKKVLGEKFTKKDFDDNEILYGKPKFKNTNIIVKNKNIL